jgi:hypothetical protein
MNVVRRWLVWLGAAALLAGCGLLQGQGSRIITGSGNVTRETRVVTGVNSVTLEGIGEVVLQQGAAEGLVIEAEDNLLPLITSAVQDGTLRLGFDRATWQDTLRPTQPIRFLLTVRDLQAFDLTGQGSLYAADLQTTGLALRISGSGDVTINHLEAGTLDVRIEGTSTVTLAGRVDDQTVLIAGTGQYQAGDLESQTARISVGGLGDAVVWVRGDLSADIGGSGTVSYWGLPTVSRRDITGTGDINPMGVK